jgi:hypothetical protein
MHAALLIKNDFEQGCSLGACVCVLLDVLVRLMTKPVFLLGLSLCVRV